MISKRERLVTDWNSEVLTYLLETEQHLPRMGDFLRDNQEIEVWMHDKLVNWIVTHAEELGAGAETIQLAITLINRFLSLVKTKKAVLQLVGLVCLMIALKFHESVMYTLDHAMLHSGNIYKKDDIQTTELFALQKLGWCLSYPTAAELSRQLLYITGVEYDFAKILDRSDAFAMICYTDYYLSQFSALVIAIVSVVCSLEQHNQHGFRNQWLKFLNSKIGMDPPELDQCKRTLVHKLYRETPEANRGKLQCLSQDSIMGLLQTLSQI